MSRNARRTIWPLLILAAAGCISKTSLVPQSFSIDAPPVSAGTPASGGRVLALSRVDVAPPYAGSSFVYRVGEHGIERDPYASFAVTPGWLLTSAVRGYLRNGSFVRDVVSPGDGVPVSATIEPRASELYADLGDPAVAVLTLQFRVLSPPGGPPPVREILLKTYSERVPLPQRTAAAVANAWNGALSSIMQSFLSDLQGALPPGP